MGTSEHALPATNVHIVKDPITGDEEIYIVDRPIRCNYCVYREGDRCYNEDLIIVTKCDPVIDLNINSSDTPRLKKEFREGVHWRFGPRITPSLVKKCREKKAAKERWQTYRHALGAGEEPQNY